MKHCVHTYSYLMHALILQFLGNEAHFASLINYQAYNENAPEGVKLITCFYDSWIHESTNFFHENLFVLFFYKEEVLYWDQKMTRYIQ